VPRVRREALRRTAAYPRAVGRGRCADARVRYATAHERPRIAVTTRCRTVWALFASAPLVIAVAACSSSPARHAGAVAAAAAVVVPGTRPNGAAAFLGVVRRVRVGDVFIAYRQFGAGAPLILIAGQYSGMNSWSV